MNKKTKIFYMLFICIFMLLILLYPNISYEGVSNGIVLSANIIIPSLFPFMVCVLMITKIKINVKSKLICGFIYKIFGHNFNMFLAFVLSMIGGYPTGATIVKELYDNDIINEKTSNIMLLYCVNAGPAFVLSVAGRNFKNQKLGVILLLSHLFSSIIIAIFFSKNIKNNIKYYAKNIPAKKQYSNVFVKSVYDASGNILTICSFIIVFSVINTYIDYFFKNINIIKYVSYFTEVSSGLIKSKNIFLTSFLLGFSGISIWCQIFAICQNIKLNKFSFIFSRFVHGLFSMIITYVLVDAFQIKISTYSNIVKINIDKVYSNVVVFLSALIMLIVLLIFIYSKNYSSKFLNDVL